MNHPESPMTMLARRSWLLALPLVLLAGLCASASVADPDATTLSRLALEADAVVEVRLVQTVAGQLMLEPLQVLAGGLDAIPEAFQSPVGLEGIPGDTGLLFAHRTEAGELQLAGGHRGWVLDDPAAVTYLKDLLRAPAGLARLEVQLSALQSASERVQQDALRDLASSPLTPELSVGQARLALDRSLRWLAREIDPAPALTLLARLPGEAGVPHLIAAAREGLDPVAVGPALSAQPAALLPLLDQLAAGQGLDAAGPVVAALGYSQSPAAVPVLTQLTEHSTLRREALVALVRIGDPASMRLFKQVLLSPQSGELGAWAAVGLAWMGGAEALGALEHARWNHPDAELRRFLARLLRDPAATRYQLERGSW